MLDMPIDLSTTLGGVTLPSCAMNAAGAGSSTEAEMRALATSEAGAVVMKSTTVQPVTEHEARLSNLVNPGYRAFLPLVGALRALGKPVIASLAGFAVLDYAEMAKAYAEAGADIIELNLADPNVVCNTSGRCDMTAVRGILSQVRAVQGQTPVAVKLPAFHTRHQLAEVLALLQEMAVPIVVCVNAPLGDAASAVTHVQVACASQAFDVVAVGGVKDARDIAHAVSQGAVAVQIGSAVQQEGPGLFARLQTELAQLLQQAGHGSLQAMRQSASS
jgi:dihydroorotate dehydrogenase (fumarate)